MHRSGPWLAAVLGAGLLLPPAGTTSRGRDFCPAWLGLIREERSALLADAEGRESALDLDPACRAGLRGGLRHALDAECRNWRRLMDFEVRAIVDRVLAPCRRS